MKIAGRDARFLLIELREVVPVARAALVGIAFELHDAFFQWLEKSSKPQHGQLGAIFPER
jgi:hypothetical protein